MTNNHSFNLVGIILFVLFTSCNPNEVYYKFEPIPQAKWNKRDEVCFDMDSVPVSLNSRYSVSIEIAHNLNYPYKNLWLSINYLHQDSVLWQDSLECILFDDSGKWLGSGNGPTRQLSVLFKTNFAIDSAKHNRICIRHAMQDIQLNGIEKIGVKVY